jgi:predicted P-loop ATPase
VIHGPQGNGKTRALSALFSPWFSEDFSTEPGQLAGVWCAEVPEVSATAKSFLARTVDRYRPPHARQALDVPRQIVFCGTTNARPAADGRRCWPVEVGAVAPIDVDGLRRDRDQLFAEAVVLFNQGEPWWPASVEPSLTS